MKSNKAFSWRVLASLTLLPSCLTLLIACGGDDAPPLLAEPGTAPASTTKAICGPGSLPETGLQGRVSPADHESGRAAQGYRCNTELVGAYTAPGPEGLVGGFKVERYVDSSGNECAYYDTTIIYPLNVFGLEAGVNVMDMSDPANPVLVKRLLSPAMLSPHESLLLNTRRGLLVAANGNPVFGTGGIDIYDVSQDCRNPVLKASTLIGSPGHESGMSPDGNTLYISTSWTPTLTAYDISNPELPRLLTTVPIRAHGLSISEDGNRAYVAAGTGPGTGDGPGTGGGVGIRADSGLLILDTSEVQSRKTNPQVPEISRLDWETLSYPQNTIPITIKGQPYVVEIDEFGGGSRVGAARIIDIADETAPKVVGDLRLEVHQPENFAEIFGDRGTISPIQGYAGHYCGVPRREDPGIVACSMIISGLRVFDIRDPHNPREVAYFNPPAQRNILTDDANYAMSRPAFAPDRNEIWYTDANSGFYAVRITNNAWIKD